MVDNNYKNKRKEVITGMLASALKYESLLAGIYAITDYVAKRGEVSGENALATLIAGTVGYIIADSEKYFKIQKLEEKLKGG